MNFAKFPANTTNIFPIANSKTGGQLLTEFNLRSRESVLTNENVKYSIGPSFCHSMDDFKVRLQTDELGVAISTTVLEITDGRAVVNGHYVESLVSITIDLAAANAQLKAEERGELKGKLAVGLRALYSTEQTLSASMRVENNVSMMSGIQVVILPVGEIKSGNFVLPEDSPNSEELVSAHLKLAEFYYDSNGIRGIQQNSQKVQAFSACRVGDFEDLLAEHYLTKDGLNPKKMYTLAGKSEDGSKLSGKPTWCDSTDSLFVWQHASQLKTVSLIENSHYLLNNKDDYMIEQSPSSQNIINPAYLRQADFYVNPSTEQVMLALPHKMPDGKMWSTEGTEELYDPRILNLPQANFAKNSPGTITSNYTKSVKAIKDSLNNFYHFTRGKQRGYIEELSTDRFELPTINKLHWSVGDYILVEKDNSVVDGTGSLIQAPSSMYVVLPPEVSEVTLADRDPRFAPDDLPAGFDGTEILKVVISYPGNDDDDQETVALTLAEYIGTGDEDEQAAAALKTYYNELFGIYQDQDSMPYNYGSVLRGSYKLLSKDNVYALGEFDSTGQEVPPILLEGSEDGKTYYDYQDYVTLQIDGVPTVVGESVVKKTHYYYYLVTKVKPNTEAYSNPVLLTGSIPLATEDTIGGFLNVSDTDLDNGYVYRDDEGHLQLLDYALLRSGVLAYQLGQDYEFGAGLSNAEIQESLNEYVNDRVAFPTAAQITQSEAEERDPNVINLTLDLSEEEDYNTINIQNIDSRWGTSLHIIITGSPSPYTTINISNCEKIRITLSLDTSDLDVDAGIKPTINLYNCGLYYDPEIIDYIRSCVRVNDRALAESASTPIYDPSFTGMKDLRLWYQQFDSDDPNLTIDGMTLTAVETPPLPEEREFWSESVINDNHYYFGLQSLTFDSNGNLIGCGLYMRNDTTANIEFGKTVTIASFTLPQGNGFYYPKTSLTKQIAVDGSFVTAYTKEDPQGYIVITTQFTALSHRYLVDDQVDTGTISFLSNAEFIENFISPTGLADGVPVDGWESNRYHVFKGWIIG